MDILYIYINYIKTGQGFSNMRLTAFSNFALRTLMYTALKDGKPASIKDISKAYGISPNHLKKASAELVSSGYLNSIQGRHGGLVLAKNADQIIIGDVIRITEENLDLVECFNAKTNTCPLISVCRLSLLFKKALNAFLTVLDEVTLADLITKPKELKPLLNIE